MAIPIHNPISRKKSWTLLGIRFLYALVLNSIFAATVQALPSMAYQTGEPCSACHVQSFGPNLTPFGRQYKLRGYMMGEPKGKLPPLSAMVMGSFTHTDSGQPGGAAPRFAANDNIAFDEASLFYGGRVAWKVGALAQLTYDGVEDRVALDNVDIRFADQATVADQDITYGLSFNNSPTAQDLWNTTPVWGFPYASSAVAPTPAAGTLIDEGLAQQVGGATAYLMLDNLLYLEAGAYTTFSRNMQNALGSFDQDENQIDGGAPYWRLALTHQWGGHYLEVGTFGLRAQVYPGRDKSVGTDSYSDLGADLTYQFLGSGAHIFEIKTTYIREDQTLNASHLLGNSNNSSNRLYTLKAVATYTFEQTYSLNLGYFRTTGSTDTGLYAPDPIDGSRTGKPNSEGFIAELDYVPFGKQSSVLAPWLNLRFALQYVGYTSFNGAEKNYDGFGRNASDNNTFFLNSWLIF